ncbi:hypothetical protein [Paraburkholderia sp. BR14374]|uniref:hypothetical protein n=1 Tax=Paraburkholderia sp. BR14374 TaxID=3237007 RepID=UPI0034CDA2BE
MKSVRANLRRMIAGVDVTCQSDAIPAVPRAEMSLFNLRERLHPRAQMFIFLRDHRRPHSKDLQMTKERE